MRYSHRTFLLFFMMVPFTVSCGNMSNRYYGKPGADASYQELLNDRYECAIETSARSSAASASVNTNSGIGASTSSSQVLPSCSLFNACLAARGWIRYDGVNLDDPNRVHGYHVPNSLGINCY